MTDILSYRHWAISREFADKVGLLALSMIAAGHSIEKLVHKKSIEEIITGYQSRMATDDLIVNTEWDRESRLIISTTRTGQNVAIIPVQGGLTKHGDICSYGMRDFIGMISRANKTEKITSIILDIESPGGTVDGTNEFGMAVKGSKKPVVAFGDSMVASAAYWVASQAREIVSNKNNSTEFGSIGVLCMVANYQAYIQKEIGSVEILRAKQSEDKARINVIEPITEEQRVEIINELSSIAKDFIRIVKAGRGSRLITDEENIFTGKMYDSKTALSLGMIDQLGTLQDAIDHAARLSNQTTSVSGFRAQSNTKIMTKSNLLSKIFGKSEKAEDEKPPTAEEIQAADAKVAEMEAENATLKAEKEAAVQKEAELNATVAEHKTQIETLTNEKKALEAKVAEQKAELDKKPTNQATTVIADKGKEETQATDKEADQAKKNAYRTSVDTQADEIRKSQQENSTIK